MRMAALVLALAAALLAGGCERMRRDMYDRSREKPLEESALFADGGSARPPVPGAVVHARGVFAGTASGRLGVRAEARRVAAGRAKTFPRPLTMALLERGRQRFDIYCAPCHSPLGDGDGMVARRGFPHPPSYHTERLRKAPDRHFYDVITDGYGIMHSYADRVAPADRWAIVAYIRALQKSQDVALSELPREVAARAGSGR